MLDLNFIYNSLFFFYYRQVVEPKAEGFLNVLVGIHADALPLMHYHCV